MPFLYLHAQETIGGVVNSYYAVDAVFTNEVTINIADDINTIKPGDKMLLIQMTGTTFSSDPVSNPTQNGIPSSFTNEGNYEFLAVQSVNTGTRRVKFTADLVRSYTSGEKIQLVKVYESKKAVVNSTLTADDWNGNKGGIIALVIYEKLTLDADIDISDKGFRGGIPVSDYTEVCRPAYDPDTFYFPSTASSKAGAKGEGIVTSSFNYTRGIGNNISGGGGGNGLFAGGGGGSNYGRGRKGGAQYDSCASSATQYAYGGIALGNDLFYRNDYNKIVMGGGGGCSTESVSNNASSGGKGAGILFILTDSLSGTGNIMAEGGSVSVTVPAGGGGGGAGGTVILDVSDYKDNLNINVSGGKGGNTSTCSGAGGGGGGGIVWYSGTSLPANVSTVLNGGARGLSSCGQNGSNGDVGGTLSELSLVLNGFLFNYILGTDTICAGNQPNVLIGSKPKGAGDLSYQWIQSTDSVNWVLASGTGDSLSFQPDPLSVTTYFSRVVSDGPVRDTARSIKVYVYPAITNNSLSVTDTLCYGQSTGMLNGGTPGGGDGSGYSFNWQSSLNQIIWIGIGSNEDIPGSSLTMTTYYRRIVQSTDYCVDTSEIDVVTVLDDITNNEFITADTMVCDNLDAGLIHAGIPQNGDGLYRYNWLVSTDNNSYSIIAGETDSVYSPGVLPASRYYKRIVYSGNDDVCADTTDTPKTVNVLNAITNNSIMTDSARYCAGDVPNPFTGTSPGGGQTGSYAYRWINRTTGNNWSYIAGQNNMNYSPGLVYEDTTEVARVVLSGDYDACRDTSNIILLDVIPYINNTLVSDDETVCEEIQPLSFTESVATGGDGSSYSYLWQYQPGGSGNWLSAPEDITPNTAVSYSSPALDQTTLFRRTVISQICESLSNSIQITVYPLIEDNVIEGATVQYTCYNSPANITGRQPSGGEGTYTYQWQISENNLAWEDASGQNTAVNFVSQSLTDSMYFRRIAFSGENQECKDTTGSVKILLNPLPEGDIQSGTDTACAGDNIVINYSVSGNGPWNLGFGSQGDEVFYRAMNISESEGSVNVPVEYENSGVVQLTELQDDSTCYADLSEVEGQIDLTVFRVPQPDPGSPDSICGLEYPLNATPSVGTGLWSGSTGSISNPYSPSTQVSVSTYGEHIFTWTETNWVCDSSGDVSVTFFEQPEYVSAGEDQSLPYNFITSLEAETPEIGTGEWSTSMPGVSFSDATLNNTQVEFDVLGSYVLLWTVYNGACIPISDSVTITVNDLKVYTGFSPNGDGVNDEFILELPGRYNTELIVLNRWGKQVFKTEGLEEIRWNGKNMDGENLPSDTYFYIVKEEGEIKTKGYVELRK